MDSKASVKLFETKRIRTAWNEDEEEWRQKLLESAEKKVNRGGK